MVPVAVFTEVPVPSASVELPPPPLRRVTVPALVKLLVRVRTPGLLSLMMSTVAPPPIETPAAAWLPATTTVYGVPLAPRQAYIEDVGTPLFQLPPSPQPLPVAPIHVVSQIGPSLGSATS